MITEKKKRGFAALSKERVRELASMGGKAAHEQGTAHIFNVDEAREAGRKGGIASGKRKREKEREELSKRQPELPFEGGGVRLYGSIGDGLKGGSE